MRKNLLTFAMVALGGFLFAGTAFAQNDTTKKSAQAAAAEAAKALADTPEAQAVVPKPVYWTKSVQTDLKFNQTQLTDWAKGGYNTITLASYVDAKANYAKDKVYWTNRLQLDYGFIKQEDRPFIQKNADRIYFESKYGRRASKNLNYTANFDFMSQFSNSYNYMNPKDFEGDEPTKKDWMAARVLKSGLFSPGTARVGFGMEWIPNPKNNWLVVNFSPLTGGFTVVKDASLRKGYGMNRKAKYKDEEAFPYKVEDAAGSTILHDEYFSPVRFELGSQLKLDLNVKINNNFTYNSQLVLFSDYLNHPQNVRVNFDNRIHWQLAKYFAFSFSTYMIYDDNVLIKNEDDLDKYPDGRQRVQLKEMTGLTFTYTFPVAKK